MRTFNLISSWLFWLVCAFYALGCLFIRGVNTIPVPATVPKDLDAFTRQYWIALAVLTVLATSVYCLRHHFWFKKNRPAGWGFWAVTMTFYFSVLFIAGAGFAPYFLGDRSMIQWASCVLGVAFTALGFPQVPRNAAGSPPPLSER
jgi:hypothetical protein